MPRARVPETAGEKSPPQIPGPSRVASKCSALDAHFIVFDSLSNAGFHPSHIVTINEDLHLGSWCSFSALICTSILSTLRACKCFLALLHVFRHAQRLALQSYRMRVTRVSAGLSKYCCLELTTDGRLSAGRCVGVPVRFLSMHRLDTYRTRVM